MPVGKLVCFHNRAARSEVIDNQRLLISLASKKWLTRSCVISFYSCSSLAELKYISSVHPASQSDGPDVSMSDGQTHAAKDQVRAEWRAKRDADLAASKQVVPYVQSLARS